MRTGTTMANKLDAAIPRRDMTINEGSTTPAANSRCSDSTGSMPSLETFGRDVKCGVKDGRYSFDCRLGLWGVDGPDMVNAFSSAWHYYAQYFSDGEYRNQSNDK